MKLGSLLLASCVLCPAGSVRAQAAVGDPISGTWTGDAGLSLTNRTPIRMELKFDGKSAVSGTITGPGNVPDLKGGTFDTTTGALRLDVELKGDGGAPGAHFVLDGTAIAGVATGRLSDGTRTGSFRLTKSGSDASPGTAAPADDAATALRKSFGEVSAWVSKSADLVPAEKYTFQATKAVRSFGQLIAHVADSYNYYCAIAAGKTVQWSDPTEKGKTDKATVVPALKKALDGCTAVYAGNGQVGALVDNVAHTSLHYGNIITYLRLMGMVPPSS